MPTVERGGRPPGRRGASDNVARLALDVLAPGMIAPGMIAGGP